MDLVVAKVLAMLILFIICLLLGLSTIKLRLSLQAPLIPNVIKTGNSLTKQLLRGKSC